MKERHRKSLKMEMPRVLFRTQALNHLASLPLSLPPAFPRLSAGASRYLFGLDRFQGFPFYLPARCSASAADPWSLVSWEVPAPVSEGSRLADSTSSETFLSGPSGTHSCLLFWVKVSLCNLFLAKSLNLLVLDVRFPYKEHRGYSRRPHQIPVGTFLPTRAGR